MKKNRIYIVLYFLTVYFPLFCQFGTAPSCTENVNKNFPGNFIGKENLINSSFMIKWNSGYACTGTLINREVPYGQLGYYFITSRHCIVNNAANPNEPLNINLNVDQRLIFNYQSKDANNSGTEIPNRGLINSQSTSLSSNGFEYIHDTKIRLVERYFWGDFALFEILTPIPPHFGVAYAGWSVRPIVFNANCINNGGQYQFTNYSHPSSDVKKIAGACVAVDKTTPIANGCYTIMTIVNTLVNWFFQIFNITYNFTTICQYVDNPWTVIPAWNVGGIAGGSSGSGIFATAGAPFISFQENKYVGTLSGGLFSCGTPTTFTKFYHNYPKTAVYSTLNPSNNWVAQTFGIGGRYTNCYNNLNNLSGYYFPKNHIGSTNTYQLSTVGSISNDPSKIWKFINGSNYKMIAQNSISLSGSSSVTVEAGATVDFKIAPCTSSAFTSFKTLSSDEDPYEKEKRETTEALLNSLKAIKVPKNKVFNEKEYLAKYHPNEVSTVTVVPNPSNGIFNISTSLKGLKKVNVKNTFAQKLIQFEINENSFTVDLSAYPAGVYNLSIFNGEENLFLKLIKE